MNYINGFRRMDTAQHFRETLAHYGNILANRHGPIQLMEVCGSHTMAIARFGIRDFLPEGISLVSGPGCPVCVTESGYIDATIELLEQSVLVTTFGDMIRVPGSHANLAQVRATGRPHETSGRYDVRVCHSPATALALARQNPKKAVVFLAVGFETTVAPIIAMLDRAVQQGITNLSLLTAFKQIPPALSALLTDPDLQIDGFLCPAHVSAIIGADAYQPLVEQYKVPCVVAGFEPLDILYGLEALLRQRLDSNPHVENQYNRVVKAAGNQRAQQMIKHYLEPSDAFWRGLGIIPASGLTLRPEYAAFDALKRHGITLQYGETHPHCRCGDVLKGKIRPAECTLFATACRPDTPIGACMVSSEGSCAAHFKYATGEVEHG